MIRTPIFYKRDKGPATPNFRRMSKLLHSKTPTKTSVDGENIILRHGGVGIKMIIVCDILATLQQLKNELKAYYDEGVVYIKKKEFYDFIFQLDIFIFELYSILDYFALEIGEILKLKKKHRNKRKDIEYFSDFGDLRKIINLDARKGQKTTNFRNLPWFRYFHGMRNRIVHRLPISLRFLSYATTVEFPLFPDHPKDPNSPSEKRIDPLTECEKWLNGVFNFIDEVCDDLGRELFINF